MSLLDRTSDDVLPEAFRGERFWRTVAAGAVGGAVVGLVTGGLLGRVAMRLLTVTSPTSARGRLTDDLEPVGRVSLDGTLALLAITLMLGAVAGLVYLWVRRVLPAKRGARAGLFALFTGTVGGSFLVHDHASFDYSVLKPEWLSVSLFLAIPGLFGLLAPSVIDRLDTQWVRRGPFAAWTVAGAIALNYALVVVAVPVVVAFLVSRSRTLRAVWRGHAVTVAGRALFAVLVLWGLYGIATDVVSIATDTPSGAPFTP